MLGKLIKYDLKYMSRFLVIIHAFFLFASVMIRLLVTGRLFTPDLDWNSPQPGMLLMLVSSVYLILFTGVYFATCLIIAIRFYKNLFSGQGYLTRTLPVTSGQHLLSKTISGSIWGCIDMTLLMLSAYIVFVTPYNRDCLKAALPTLRDDLGFTGAYENLSFETLAAYILLVLVIGVIGSIITFYASIVIGQLVSGHRILGAVAAYFVIGTVFSILALIALAVTGLLTFSPEMIDSFSPIGHLLSTMKISIILSVIQNVILYAAAYWIMDKKINLE